MEHYNWGIPVAIDLFAAALGAAIFMVAVVADLAGGRKYRRISITGALIAPWPAILGVLLLVVDLGKPWRFWEMILRRSHETLGVESLMFKIGSTMSIGTWLLTILCWDLCYTRSSLFSPTHSNGPEHLRKCLELLGCLLHCWLRFIPVY